MKLNRHQINVRLPVKLLDKMRLIQKYKARTATIIIEDALEKGLAWYLKQISGELGRGKENPLTWEALAEMMEFSDSHQENDTTENISDEEADRIIEELFTGEDHKKL